MKRMRGLLLAAATALLATVGTAGAAAGYALAANASPAPRLATLPDNQPTPTPRPTPKPSPAPRPATLPDNQPATSNLLNISPHLFIHADDSRTSNLQRGWTWILDYNKGKNPQPTEFTMWVGLCGISPERNTCTGQLGEAFRSFAPNLYVERAFNENLNMVLTETALVTLTVPGSFINQALEDAEKAASGRGWTMVSDPNGNWLLSPDKSIGLRISLGRPDLEYPSDFTMFKGPFFSIYYRTFGRLYFIAAENNEAFQLKKPTVATSKATDSPDSVLPDTGNETWQWFYYDGPTNSPIVSDEAPGEAGGADEGGTGQ